MYIRPPTAFIIRELRFALNNGRMTMDEKIYGFKIGEMADYFGVSTDTLRIYDRKGVIPAKKDSHNQYRFYNREDFIILDYIMRLRKTDMPLKDIRHLINESTLEESLSAMKQHSELLAQKINDYQNKIAVVKDYIESFSNTISSLNNIQIEMSKPIIFKSVGQNMTTAMSAFNDLTQLYVPKLTFIVPKLLVDVDESAYTLENFNFIKKQFRYALTMEDDGDFHLRDDFPTDVFTYYPPRKSVHASISMITNQDYSEYYKCLSFIRENGLELDGPIMLRTISFRNYDVAYYDFWAPIK